MIHNSVGLQASRGLAAHDRAHRVIYRLAFAAACFGTVVGQLHALARFATPDGQKDLPEPGRRLKGDRVGIGVAGTGCGG